MSENKWRSEATFRFTVPHLSKQVNSVFSPPFYVRNLPWKILIKKSDKNSLSFYLRCNSGSNSSWSCYAIAELRLLSVRQNVEPFSKTLRHLFYSKENDWGFPNFMDLQTVLNKQRGYIQEDAITVEVYVNTSIPYEICSDIRIPTNQFQVIEQIINTMKTAIDKLQNKIEGLQTKNEELPLRNFNIVHETTNVIRQVLNKFETKACDRFEHDIEFAANNKIHLRIVRIDDANLHDPKSDLAQQERDKLTAAIARLRKELHIRIPTNQFQVVEQINTMKTEIDEAQNKMEGLQIKNEELPLRNSNIVHETTNEIQQVLNLFESKACVRFEHDIEFAANNKIHLRMVRIDDVNLYDPKSDLEQQERDKLKAEIARLTEELELRRMKQQQSND